jgi:hypothetical protein
VAEFSCLVDGVDRFEGFFDGSCYVGGVEEIGLDLGWEAG